MAEETLLDALIEGFHKLLQLVVKTESYEEAIRVTREFIAPWDPKYAVIVEIFSGFEQRITESRASGITFDAFKAELAEELGDISAKIDRLNEMQRELAEKEAELHDLKLLESMATSQSDEQAALIERIKQTWTPEKISAISSEYPSLGKLLR